MKKKVINYLDFVEEYQTADRPVSQFEKVMILSGRAKDLYEGKTARIEVPNHKPTATAQIELNEGSIEPNITEKIIENNLDDFDDDEIEEE